MKLIFLIIQVLFLVKKLIMKTVRVMNFKWTRRKIISSLTRFSKARTESKSFIEKLVTLFYSQDFFSTFR